MADKIQELVRGGSSRGSQSARETILEGIASDLTTIKAEIDLIHTSFATLTAQLDADTGVNDTDYATNCDPAAATALITNS